MLAIQQSKTALWVGRVLSALAVLFLALDGVMKVLGMAPAIEATTRLGYPADRVAGLGVLLLVCLVIYIVPRTSVLGAILLTGYLGGAIATHVRAGEPLFSVIFPLIMGALLWGGLFLREPRLRALLPLLASERGAP